MRCIKFQQRRVTFRLISATTNSSNTIDSMSGIQSVHYSVPIKFLDVARKLKLCPYTTYYILQCVSKKNIPDIFSCNSRKHCRIFIIFGTHVTEKVSNQ